MFLSNQLVQLIRLVQLMQLAQLMQLVQLNQLIQPSMNVIQKNKRLISDD